MTEKLSLLPQQWLGDSDVLAMDWDVRAIHWHLICLAFQQTPKGYLPNNKDLIRKMVGSPKDWEERIAPQIFSTWKPPSRSPKKLSCKFLQDLMKVKEPTSTPKKGKPITLSEVTGFRLESILNKSAKTTILFEAPSKQEVSTIWKTGVELFEEQGIGDKEARGVIGRLIKKHGEKPVALAITQISLMNKKPADIVTYLSGTIRRMSSDSSTPSKSRGRVAL